jgi:DNA-binding NarL/FixJ family response regulator
LKNNLRFAESGHRIPIKEGDQMFPKLTTREQQILDLVAEGLTNRKISSNLSISESTVENHVHHIFMKMAISNRAQAVARAFQLRISLQNEMLKNRGNPS